MNIENMTLYDSLAQSADRFPDRCAIDFYGKKLSYSRLKDYADRFGSLLIDLGVKAGDRVVICVRNSPQFVFSLYGSSKIGAIFVPVSFEYSEKELSNVLFDCAPKVFIHEAGLNLNRVKPERKEILTDADSFITEKEDELLDMVAHATTGERRSGDIALIMYTSGTAGILKGVKLTNRNVLTSALNGSIWCNKSENDKSLAVLPFSHVLGLVESLCGSILSGSEVVILKKFHTMDAAEAIEREKCTICTGVPPIFKALLRDKDHELSSLRLCFVGGAPITTQDLEAFEARAGCELLEGYGLTESAAALTINPPGKAKHGSVGIPVSNVSFRVMGGKGKELGAKEVGELVFKGPQITEGYWNNEQESKRALKDGWLYTGDLGYFDEDGYIYLKGRVDDMINISGYKVMPEEIEGALMENKKVKEACAIGIRKDGKELIKAFVVLKEEANERELIEWCRGKLSSYKCPSEIEFIESIPKSASGKVLRRMLR